MLAAILRAILQYMHVPGERDLHQDTEAWPFLLYLTETTESFQGDKT